MCIYVDYLLLIFSNSKVFIIIKQSSSTEVPFFVNVALIRQFFGCVSCRLGFNAWPTIRCNQLRPPERSNKRNDIRIQINAVVYISAIQAHVQVCHYLFNEVEFQHIESLLRPPYSLNLPGPYSDSQRIDNEITMLLWYLLILPKLLVVHDITKYGIGAVLARLCALGVTKKIKWPYNNDSVHEGLLNGHLQCFHGFRRDVMDISVKGIALEKTFVHAEETLIGGIQITAQSFFMSFMLQLQLDAQVNHSPMHEDELHADNIQESNEFEIPSESDSPSIGIASVSAISTPSLLDLLGIQREPHPSIHPGHDYSFVGRARMVHLPSKDTSVSNGSIRAPKKLIILSRKAAIVKERVIMPNKRAITASDQRDECNQNEGSGGLRQPLPKKQTLSECFQLRIPFFY